MVHCKPTAKRHGETSTAAGKAALSKAGSMDGKGGRDMMKLSKLQRWILTRAAESPDANQSYQPRDLITSRVLNEFYGLPLKRDKASVRWGECNFDLTTIDRRRYDACKSAVSKAFARLTSRGLAVQHQGGSLKLNPNGLQWVKLTSCKPLQAGMGAV